MIRLCIRVVGVVLRKIRITLKGNAMMRWMNIELQQSTSEDLMCSSSSAFQQDTDTRTIHPDGLEFLVVVGKYGLQEICNCF